MLYCGVYDYEVSGNCFTFHVLSYGIWHCVYFVQFKSYIVCKISRRRNQILFYHCHSIYKMYILGKDYMYIMINPCRNIHQSYKFNIQFLVNGKLNFTERSTTQIYDFISYSIFKRFSDLSTDEYTLSPPSFSLPSSKQISLFA